MNTWHAITTTDLYTDLIGRYDLTGTRDQAEQEARERHGHETGIDTADVSTCYLGVVPTLPNPNDYDDTPADLQAKLAYRRRQVQRTTVKRLNDLTSEHNGRVRAEAVDAEASELCSNDTGHGSGTVVFTVPGDQFELCPDCAERTIGGMLRDGRVVSDSNDLIDVEVYL